MDVHTGILMVMVYDFSLLSILIFFYSATPAEIPSFFVTSMRFSQNHWNTIMPPSLKVALYCI